MTGFGEANFLYVWLSQLIFIIPTCILVPATKNDIKVILDQQKVKNPCSKDIFKLNFVILFQYINSQNLTILCIFFQHILFRFFDMPKYDLIVFRMNTAGLLTCATEFPPISRGKMIYFLRNFHEKIKQTNFRKV